MPDPDVHKLTAPERRIAIARHDYNTCFASTQQELAEKFSESQPTICKDRNHADYIAEIESLKGSKVRALKVQDGNV